MSGSGPLRVLVLGARDPAEPFLERMFEGVARHGVEMVRPGARRARGGTGTTPLRAVAGDRPSARSLREAWRESFQDADLVYVPWIAGVVERPWLRHCPVPLVVSCRGAQINVAPWNPRRSALRDGLPHAFAAAAAVHCVSRAMAREATQHGLAGARAAVITPAVDIDRFRPPDTDPAPVAPFRLVSVGTTGWRKGHEYALRAIRLAVDRGIDLEYRVVGALDGAEPLRHTIADLRLDDVVELVGPVEPDAVPRHLGWAGAYLQPSVSEGLANGTLEAMACGVPPVVSDVGGMDEAVTHGRDGLLVAPRDPDAIADAIARLADDPTGRVAMGNAARRRVAAEFRLVDHCVAFAHLFREAAA